MTLSSAPASPVAPPAPSGSLGMDATAVPVKLPSIWRRLYRRIRSVLALFGLLVLIYTACFSLDQIVSPSMSPTLQGTAPGNGDWVISEKISYHIRSPRRWELLRFIDDEGMHVMKRVVGLPGERVRLVDNQLSINGVAIDRPQSLRELIYYPFGPQLHNGLEAQCGNGYFVFGDDSKDSYDSRYVGPIKPERMRGRPWLIIWPRSRIGFVNP